MTPRPEPYSYSPDGPENDNSVWDDLRTRRASQPPLPVRQMLRQLGLPPLKQLGQNFLVDETVLQRIIRAADLSPTDLVLEIGPGLGILTKEIAAHAARVVAVEIDKGMVFALRKTLADLSNVELVHADILKVDPSQYFPHEPYKVVANLPYYITSPTLRHLMETSNRPRAMVVMVQREVAERIVARPGDMSLLSVSVQVFGEPKIITFVPQEAFYPPPKVESAVLRIDVYDRPAVEIDLDKFFKVVQSGFSRPRKMIHNSLSQSLWMPPGGAVNLLRAVGIDEKRRAETLSVEEWEAVAKEMEQRGFV